MSRCVIITYTSITHAGAIPAVMKRLVHDLEEFGASKVLYHFFDFKYYYRLNDFGELINVGKPTSISNRTYITIPVGPPHLLIAHILRRFFLRDKNIILPWGMFCRQQYQRHWNSGKTPLFLKKIYLKSLRLLCLNCCDGFMVHSKEEAEFSGINLARCVLVTMGRAPSAILDSLDKLNANLSASDYSNKHYCFIGRGQFREKGILKITNFAKSSTGSKMQFSFFCSSRDEELEKHLKNSSNPRETWDFETSGSDLVPIIRRSQAYITVSDNPIQIRTPYEVLCLGTPVITQAESMMEGMKRMFARAGFPQAIQIVDPSSFESGNFNPAEMLPEERMSMSRAACSLLHPKLFAEWLDDWLLSPRFPADFYSDATIDQNQDQSHL